MRSKSFGPSYGQSSGKDVVNHLKVFSATDTQFQCVNQFAINLINVGLNGSAQLIVCHKTFAEVSLSLCLFQDLQQGQCCSSAILCPTVEDAAYPSSKCKNKLLNKGVLLII